MHEPGSHVVVWTLALSPSDKLSPPWNNLPALLSEYIDPASTAGNHVDTTSAPPEVRVLCAQLAVSARTPLWSHLETYRGVRTAVALETSATGGVRVLFPTAPWYRRSKGRLAGEVVQRSSLVASAMHMTRRLTRSSLGSEESQSSAWTKSS